VKKAEARIRARNILRRIDAESRSAHSAAIARALAAAPVWRSAGTVLAYLSMSEEVDTAPIIETALAEGKIVAVPRIAGKDIVFHRMKGDSGALARDRLGIPEPDPSWPVFDGSPDSGGRGVLIVAPGLAFDRDMHRLGRGKGFYDRYLRLIRAGGARLDIAAVAVCFAGQLWEHVPHAAGDEPMDGIVTETEALGRLDSRRGT
jgi:5-formyltetrahydrofolate cyclo-ligase